MQPVMTTNYKHPGVLITAGQEGYNEYGLPLHACNGNIQDAHYWAYVRNNGSLVQWIE